MNYFKQSRPVSAVLYTLLVATVLAAPAMARDDRWDNNDSNNGRWEHSDHWDRHDDRRDSRTVVVRERFRDNDRVVISNYQKRWYHEHCRPGYASRYNACYRHGNRVYVVGQPLPEYVVARPLPRYIYQEVGPAPYGYEYVMVDQDVVLRDRRNGVIVDALSLLSDLR